MTEAPEVLVEHHVDRGRRGQHPDGQEHEEGACLLYTSDAADERSSVDLGGRRIIKKKNHKERTHGTIQFSTRHYKHNSNMATMRHHEAETRTAR